MFVFTSPTCPCCASALPQELSHGFCNQTLQLSSRIAYGSDCQMTCRGLNLDSNLNSAAWPTVTNGLKRCYLLQNSRMTCVEFEFFLGPITTPKLKIAVSADENPHPQDWHWELFWHKNFASLVPHCNRQDISSDFQHLCPTLPQTKYRPCIVLFPCFEASHWLESCMCIVHLAQASSENVWHKSHPSLIMVVV